MLKFRRKTNRKFHCSYMPDDRSTALCHFVYANVAAYLLAGYLVMSPSWPISIIHSSSTLTFPFLLPYLPPLICRQVLVCWYWQGNGETGCELTTEQHGYTCECKRKTLKWKTKRKWGSENQNRRCWGGGRNWASLGRQTGNTTEDNFSISGIPSRGWSRWAHEAIDAANWLFLAFAS